MQEVKQEYISKQDLAKKLGLSPATILRLEKKGLLPQAWRPTATITLYKLSDCIAYIENHSTSASA